MTYINVLSINYATDVLKISNIAAAAGLAAHGATAIPGILLVFSTPKLRQSHFLLHGLSVLVFGLSTLGGAFMRNEVGGAIFYTQW